MNNPTAGDSLSGIKHSRTFRQRGKEYKPGLRPASGSWLLITRPAGPWDVPARRLASGVNKSKHSRPNSPAASQTANFIPVAQSSPMQACPCEEAGSQPRRAYITVWRHLCVTLYSNSMMLARGYGRSNTYTHTHTLWQKWPERWRCSMALVGLDLRDVMTERTIWTYLEMDTWKLRDSDSETSQPRP